MTRPSQQGWRKALGKRIPAGVAVCSLVVGVFGPLFVGAYALDRWQALPPPQYARDERALPSLAVTPLRSLPQAAAAAPVVVGGASFHDGTLVRVEGFLRAEPPCASLGSGEAYALRYLETWHQETSAGLEGGELKNWVTDGGQYYKPPHLWLEADPARADEGRVEVHLRKDWRRNLAGNFSSSGEVPTPAAIPEGVARAMGVESLPTKAGRKWDLYRWSLYAVPQNVRVSVVAPAYLRGSQVVLETDKARFGLVSPAAWKDIVRAPTEFPWGLVLGGLGGCVLLLGVFWVFVAA